MTRRGISNMANFYAYRLKGNNIRPCQTTERDRGGIQALLSAANGRATAHTITSPPLVSALAHKAERRLDAAGLSLKERPGACLVYRPGGPSASAYKYRAATTAVVLKRNGVGWRVDKVSRDDVVPRQTELFDLQISPNQAGIVQAKALTAFNVTEEGTN
jgi:hypothetical protein